MCTGGEMLQFLAPPTGQIIRRVKRKRYGPNDLVSTESQTDDTNDLSLQRVSIPSPQTLVWDKKMDRRLRNMFLKLK
jgi:hypothetical protein